MIFQTIEDALTAQRMFHTLLRLRCVTHSTTFWRVVRESQLVWETKIP